MLVMIVAHLEGVSRKVKVTNLV